MTATMTAAASMMSKHKESPITSLNQETVLAGLLCIEDISKYYFSQASFHAQACAPDRVGLAPMEEEEIVKSAQVISGVLKALALLAIIALAVWAVRLVVTPH
jgi:hypothetical protein